MNRSKSPDRTNPHRGVLDGVDLIAKIQKLGPRCACEALTRTPVDDASKPVRAASKGGILGNEYMF